MKRKIIFFFVSALLVISSTNVFSQLFEENFEYPEDSLITKYGWIPFSGIGINPVKVVYPGLEFPCYSCIFGNAAKLVSTGEDSYKYLSRKVTSGSVYVSFMVKFDTAKTGDVFIHLSDSSVNNNDKVAEVYARDSSGKIAFGLAKEGNNNEIYGPAKYSRDTTYLLVLKYTVIAGSNNDCVSLFVFSPPACLPSLEPPTPTLGPLCVGTDAPNIGKIILEQGAGSKGPILIIDGICASTIWDDGALPVELSAFTSSVDKRDATLYWTTVSETNNSGFNIERSTVNGEWSMIGNVTGNGTSTTSHSYSFTDKELNSGMYNYRLKQIDFNGNFEYFNLNNEVVIGVPSQFNVSQNYPNPFNPSTKINYDIPVDGKVSVKIFDMSGKEVASLVDGIQTAGYYTLSFNANNLSSGIYFYSVNVDGADKNFAATKKMILVK